MNSENNNINFKKTMNNDSNKNIKPKNQQNLDEITSKLVAKYNISPKEAEKLIMKAKKRHEQKENNQKLSNMSPENQIPLNQNTTKKNNQEYLISNNNNSNSQQYKQQNVDTILSDIIPNYKEKLSVELQNVNLTFDITSDKIDTIKETIIRTVTRTKSKKIKFQALNNINLKIYKGEKVGIIGYNGAGKSTLLHVITGIYPPDSGKVITYGKISPLLSLGAGFDFNYSGRKNIYLNGAVLGYDKNFLKEKENEIIEFSELEEFIDIPIKNYSSGMLAKLGFSIATIVEPDILIVDEILGVGDVAFQKKSNDKMKSLMESGTTVILVSHSMHQIREICDKAIWIDKGKVREIGEVNEVCDNYIKDSEKASKEQIANIQFR